MLKEAQVVVCTSLVAKEIRHLAPRETETIVDDSTLNKGGLEMLRQRPAQMLSELENRGARHARH
jgi:siroheme synthase